MTDSIYKPTINISSLEESTLRKIFATLHSIVDLKGHEPSAIRPNYKSILLPLGGSGKLFIKGLHGNGSAELPTHLEFKNFHAPSVLSGHNLLHGTSVYATSVACLWAFKIYLATIGIERTAIDCLTIDDVSVEGGVDLSFLRAHKSASEAARFVALFGRAAEASGRKVDSHSSTNVTCDVAFNGTDILGYNKSDLRHCKLPKNAIGESVRQLGEAISRIEIKARGKLLRELGLDKPSAWLTAHADGLYKTLYEDHVSKALHVANLKRRKKPYPEAIEAAVEDMSTERREDALKLLEWYFEGGDVRHFENSRGFKLTAGQLRKFRSDFLTSLGIDLEVTWATSVFLAMSGAEKLLEYPGDYHPENILTKACFCKNSWPEILKRLKKTFEDVLFRQNPRKPIDPETGEILNF
jgi:hypothetical protein